MNELRNPVLKIDNEVDELEEAILSLVDEKNFSGAEKLLKKMAGEIKESEDTASSEQRREWRDIYQKTFDYYDNALNGEKETIKKPVTSAVLVDEGSAYGSYGQR